MLVKLLHNHYDSEKLEKVKEIMKAKGSPVIRVIWDDMNGIWMAIEGCHRIRAAKDLGLNIILKDVSEQKQVRYQQDDESVRVSVKKLKEELLELWRNELVEFDSEFDY